MRANTVAVFIFVMLTLQIVHIQGGTCYFNRWRLHYYSHKTCGTWCWSHKWVTRSEYRQTIESKCCPGYTGYRCNTPICAPRCINGGTCVAPNKCRCPNAFKGAICSQVLCSHLKPCFPGNCTAPHNCACQSGFTQTSCLALQATERPHITQCNAYLVNIKRIGNIEQYRFMADSTSPNASTVDVIWVRQKDYNLVNIHFEAMYTYNPPVIPNYIGNYAFGVVSGKAQLILSKIPRPSNVHTRYLHKPYTCPVIPGNISPERGVFRCNITDNNFPWILEDGDNLTVTVQAASGGFRELLNVNSNNIHYTNEIYTGVTASKSMKFMFDFDSPVHCSENGGSCIGKKALSLQPDLTKQALTLSCTGWTDKLSGLKTSTYHIYRLKPDEDSSSKDLTEIDPRHPITSNSRNITDGTSCHHFKYFPSEIGMYSIILEMADKANNTKYARRVALYDPTSSITINKEDNSELYVESAAVETRYHWVNNTQNEYGQGIPLTINWHNHFENKVHTQGHLLNRVKPFVPQKYSKYFRTISIPPILDDTDGSRTLNPIMNVLGIVNAEIAFKSDHHGGSTINTEPTSNWENIATYLNQETNINVSRTDGDTIRIWLRVYNAVGNTAVDTTTVNVDSSPPTNDHKPSFIRNVKNGSYPFMSSMEVTTYDKQSGIHVVKFRLVSNSTGEIYHSGELQANRSDENNLPVQLGYCTRTDECFNYLHVIDLDNCWFVVPKNKLKSQVTDVEMTIYNQAMLETTVTYSVNNLIMLDGIEEYPGPMGLHVSNIGSHTIRFDWHQAPTCYQRSEFLLKYNSSSGIEKVMHIHKEETHYSLGNLDPETDYDIEFITIYAGKQQSDPVIQRSRTIDEVDSGVPAGVIAAVVAVIVILVGVLLVGIFMWRTGRLNRVKESIYGTIDRRLTKRNTRSRGNNKSPKSAAFNNKSYVDYGEEEIYLYSDMDMNSAQTIPGNRISLVEKMTSGRFADIYKANYNDGARETTTVVAKILKESYVEFDELVMKAKINFFSSKVGTHSSILQFIGSVTDNTTLGPYMILEYCEHGTLRNWLQKQKATLTESVIDRLHRMSYEIAKGMEFLSSKQIVHRHLAARNVLLNFLLEPKITGFGPNKESEHDDLDPNKERLPLKWLAPECMKSLRDANSDSDVWSFGILMWEIFSLGDTPYPKISSRDVKSKLTSGYRMESPEVCDGMHHSLMLRCWQFKPADRPKFKGIVNELDKAFHSDVGDQTYYYAGN